MSLPPGTRLGPYEILAPIGAGGMGEVYSARDPRLGRDVAIKVLPAALSADADRLHRFELEARAAAALNHPNIVAVFDIGVHDAAPYIVQELLQGETLRTRVAKGSSRGSDTAGGGAPAGDSISTSAGLAVRKAIDYAVQIARGLAAAHDKGIVHRDLKPENVFVTTDGHVKILDFGLAKLVQMEPALAGTSPAPTKLADTQPGLLLGTMGYMAPEQARGQPVDHRADIFALGSMLYEMLSGHRAFAGPTPADTISAILEKDPPDLPITERHIPPGLARIVDRCLEKDPAARFQSTRDLTFALEAIDTRSGADTPSPAVPGGGSKVPGASRRNERLAWTAAFVLVTATAVIMTVRALRPVLPPAQVRLDITTPPTSDFVSLAISPDGLKVVFVANSDGRSRLWLRSLDSGGAQPLNGTDGAAFPFWSPDNRSVGFFADGKLKRIDIDGGAVQDLAIATAGRGGAWNRDGVILFQPSPGRAPILRTSATGGEPAAVTRVEAPQQASHRFPQFLPDGRHFIYYVQGTPETRGVYLGQLDGTDGRRLVSADAAAVCASSWRLLFVRQGTLFAQDLDPDRLGLTGTPSPVAEHVFVDAVANVAALSASAAGPIVFRAGASAQRQLVWFDRSGKELDKVGDPDSAGPLNPSMSPDGRFVALQRPVNGNVDIWSLELRRGVLNRFTTDEASENMPTWSPDGNRIVFQSNRKGVYDLYQKPATGAGSEELLLASSQNKAPSDWSPDGRFLLYRSLDPKMSYDIWALPMDGDRHPFPVVQTKFEEREAQFSPDGKWFAYQSAESGRVEIYIQAFPRPGARTQVSTTGGAQVRWRRNGKELFYIALDSRLMAVPIQFGSTGQAVEAGAPVPLFVTRVGGAVPGVNVQQYMVSPDGQRFLVNTLTDEAIASPITVVLNWKPKS